MDFCLIFLQSFMPCASSDLLHQFCDLLLELKQTTWTQCSHWKINKTRMKHSSNNAPEMFPLEGHCACAGSKWWSDPTSLPCLFSECKQLQASCKQVANKGFLHWGCIDHLGRVDSKALSQQIGIVVVLLPASWRVLVPEMCQESIQQHTDLVHCFCPKFHSFGTAFSNHCQGFVSQRNSFSIARM